MLRECASFTHLASSHVISFSPSHLVPGLQLLSRQQGKPQGRISQRLLAHEALLQQPGVHGLLLHRRRGKLACVGPTLKAVLYVVLEAVL